MITTRTADKIHREIFFKCIETTFFFSGKTLQLEETKDNRNTFSQKVMQEQNPLEKPKRGPN